MENAIFYTFSTIPQVLAGAIALIGVFALYKIQELNNSIIGYGESFSKKYFKNDDLKTRLDNAITKKGHQEILDIMVNVVDDYEKAITENERKISNFKKATANITNDAQKRIDATNLANMNANLGNLKIKDGELAPIRVSTKDYLNKKSKIKGITKLTTFYTAFIIIGSLFILPNAPIYVCSENLDLLFRITFLLVAINIVLMVKIIITSL